MANRRMYAKSVIDTDKFMEMPISTQCLYFHLLLRGDDDGFVASPKLIMRQLRASEDDMKLLIAKEYVIPEELERHMAEIVNIEDRRELCKDCNGDCRQHTQGYFMVVSPTSTGLFHSAMQMCDHERARREQRRLSRLISDGIGIDLPREI